MTNDTWTCHICGEEKADAYIDVLSYPEKDFKSMTNNVRYCTDNTICYSRALGWKEKGRFPDRP